LYWVCASAEDNWNAPGDSFGCQRLGQAAWCRDDCHAATNQIGRQFRQSVIAPFGPAIFDCRVLTLDVASFLEALTKRGDVRRKSIWRSGVEKSDHWHGGLLCTRRERPRSRRAADERDELAAPHSITSSARPSSVIGKVRPSALAVLRLIANSTFTACWTGSSAGRAPLRIRPV
jgi:hypothetical protein